ncbi:fungal-specific transcription factor domain-domain-containing protein [Naematelia encephala]|uniref:Fungal-specific transcription factor domain-domain-containing protein n=1 Tax=Naematelia encephala TaxID=71784 RepID=A0A1Y2B438_9TREE|nr:fungal-specific transcription factor domain-domain-containing protein [Naematelia encephala]
MADLRSPTSTSPSTDNDDSSRAVKRRAFACPHSGCNKSFGRRDYLERHSANHMISRPFSCPSCSKSFARADVLKRHILNHPRRRTASIGLVYAQDIMTSPGTDSLSTTGSTQDSSPTSFFTQMETISAVRGDHSTPGSVVQQTSEVDLAPGPLVSGPLAFPADTSTEVDLTAGFSLDDLYTWFLSCDPATGDPALAADIAIGQPEPSIPLAAITLPQPSDGSELTDEDDSPDELIGLGMWRRIRDLCQDTLHSALPAEGFSLNDMNMYIDLYFLHFDPLYPILHRPTLKLRSPSPSLFLAMISIGSAYSSDTSTSDALLLIHRKLRNYMLEILEDSSRPALADLQTMLLISYFGRMYGTSKYQDANQVFHAACVTAARLSGIFDVKVPHSDRSEEAGLGAWCLWADAEESVRAAWMVFASDVSNAMMMGHGLTSCMSRIEEFALMTVTITSPLPCDDRRWSADALAGWSETHDASQLEFPDIMRHLLDEATLPNGLSSFGHWIVLHGLMSLT